MSLLSFFPSIVGALYYVLDQLVTLSNYHHIISYDQVVRDTTV